MTEKPKFRWARLGLVMLIMGCTFLLLHDSSWTEAERFWVSLALVTIGSVLFTSAGDWSD